MKKTDWIKRYPTFIQYQSHNLFQGITEFHTVLYFYIWFYYKNCKHNGTNIVNLLSTKKTSFLKLLIIFIILFGSVSCNTYHPYYICKLKWECKFVGLLRFRTLTTNRTLQNIACRLSGVQKNIYCNFYPE